MAPSVYDKGVPGVVDAKGKVQRIGCKFVVVSQPDVSDDPVPYMYAATEADAKEYIKSMKSTGHGAGLRIVKPEDL